MIVFVALFFGIFSPIHAAVRDIRVISSDQRGLTLELVGPFPEIEEVTLSGRLYSKLRLQGWAKTVTPGYPELPVQGLLIQVPDLGKISIEVIESSAYSFPNLLISPVSKRKLTDKGLVINEFAIDPSIYSSSQFFPQSIAEVQRVGIIRGVPVARVLFHPFQWDPLSRELRCYQKIVVKVHFEYSLPAQSSALSATGDSVSQDGYSRLHRRSIINYSPVEHRGYEKENKKYQLLKAKTKTSSLKIMVNRNGIYRISYNEMKKSGINLIGINPQTFRLHNMGNEVALRVVPKSAKLRSGDYIEFYAEGIDNTFTDTNVYWLSWGGENGKRMNIKDGTVTGQGVELTSFLSTIHFEENHTLWENMPEAPEQDYWFWGKITAPVTKNYSLSIPSPIPSNNGKIKVCFRGGSTASPSPNHHTVIKLNGTQIGDAYWDKDIEFVQEVEISPGLLNEGTNTLTIEAPGDTGAPIDVFYLNWIEVDYWRRFEAEGGELTFVVTGNGRFKIPIKELSNEDISIYDITDPYNVSFFQNYSINTGAMDYTATFEDEIAGQKTYFAFANTGTRTPLSIELWEPANLKAENNSADYIAITPREFLSEVKSLCRFREKQGLKTLAVAVEDIYNEFNYGLIDPKAIKDFLEYAYKNWVKPAPTYVALIGDANIDYRDYLGTGKKSRVPVHLSSTSGLRLTPDDNWYVTVEGDDALPEMFIGRIPSADIEAVEDMVDKIKNYEKLTSYEPREALFAADNNDTYFETINEELIEYLPADFVPQRIYLRSYSDVETATLDIISNINRGMLLTNYVGHGDVIHWAGEGLLEPSDIDLLNNRNRLTFVITLDCLNGYFAQPYYYSIGESFVVPKNKGAIAAFSPSGLGYPWEHMILGNSIYSLIFEEGIDTLGEITTRSKIDAFANGASEDLVKTFTLLGDPATQLRRGN
jgi:hypothetical protein